jgi:hypothetical protein
MGSCVVPQAKTVGCDATLGRYSGGFDHEQSCATVEQIGPMHQMPIVGLAIQIAGILAHGCDHDAIGQAQWAAGRTELKGGEKLAHGWRIFKKELNMILSPKKKPALSWNSAGF